MLFFQRNIHTLHKKSQRDIKNHMPKSSSHNITKSGEIQPQKWEKEAEHSYNKEVVSLNHAPHNKNQRVSCEYSALLNISIYVCKYVNFYICVVIYVLQTVGGNLIFN